MEPAASCVCCARSLTQQLVSIEQVGQPVVPVRRHHYSFRVLRDVEPDSVPFFNVEVVRIRESVVNCKKGKCLVVTCVMCRNQAVCKFYKVTDSVETYLVNIMPLCCCF